MNRFHHVRIKLESFLNNLSLKKKTSISLFFMYSGPHIFDRYCNFTCINQERAYRAAAPDGKNIQISAVDAFRLHRRFRADFYQPVYG